MQYDSPDSVRVAVYGKGGVGKSFVSANLAVALANSGKKTVLVGCDPKGDSCRNLVPKGKIKLALPLLLDQANPPRGVSDLIVTGSAGVACIEAGGPEPGEGCGGMGVLRLFQFLERQDFVAAAGFDALVFDVLGDVVCGGFAAPMKFAAPMQVLVVVSDDVHSLYAANRIAMAVCRYGKLGVTFAGLVVNRRQDGFEAPHVEQFATRLSTRILATLPRAKGVLDADSQRTPASLHPACPELRRPFVDICETLCLGERILKPVTPLTQDKFDDLMLSSGAQ